MFIQPDWFEVTKAGVGTNRYAYSLNDPISKLDPSGNGWISKVWKFVKSGFNLGETFAGATEDVGTLISPTSTGWQKAGAGISLASEALPVSVRDAKAAGKWSKRKAEQAWNWALGGRKRKIHVSGISLPKSQSQMIKEFNQAGFPKKPVVSPTSGKVTGVQYTLPDGSRVRIMQSDSRSPRRASFENRNGQPIDPTTGKPPQPPSGLTRAERKQYVRERTHLVQVP